MDEPIVDPPMPEPVDPKPEPIKYAFKVVKAASKVPAGCKWSTVADVKAQRDAAFKLLKTWSIVMLADGKIDGPGYGSKIHPGSKHKVGEKLIGCSDALKPKPEPKPEPPRMRTFGREQKGFCVMKNGATQRSGIKTLNTKNIDTKEKEEECKTLCSKVKGVTGCVTIRDQKNRGCYAHTHEVSRANGNRNHKCWLALKTEVPKGYEVRLKLVHESAKQSSGKYPAICALNAKHKTCKGGTDKSFTDMGVG